MGYQEVAQNVLRVTKMQEFFTRKEKISSQYKDPWKLRKEISTTSVTMRQTKIQHNFSRQFKRPDLKFRKTGGRKNEAQSTRIFKKGDQEDLI